MINKPKISFLVLDFKKPEETKVCLESIRKFCSIPHKIIYLDNGSNESYPFEYYKNSLCDVLISKKIGNGGGEGQTDLIRYCDTEYFCFVQNDQELIQPFDSECFEYFCNLLNTGFKCVNLNGNQGHGKWTDRAHMMRTDFFNSLAPFPNGGPGLDGIPWNEAYISNQFKNNNHKIAIISPLFFRDNGKWSVREAGDGLYKHRCDTKLLIIIKQPTYKTPVFPPFDDSDWELALSGKWPQEGKIPNLWKEHSFRYWND